MAPLFGSLSEVLYSAKLLEGFLSGKLMFNNAENWCIIEKVIVEADLILANIV